MTKDENNKGVAFYLAQPGVETPSRCSIKAHCMALPSLQHKFELANNKINELNCTLSTDEQTDRYGKCLYSIPEYCLANNNKDQAISAKEGAADSFTKMR